MKLAGGSLSVGILLVGPTEYSGHVGRVGLDENRVTTFEDLLLLVTSADIVL